MRGLSSSELLFYMGIGGMCLTSVVTVLFVIIFRITGKKIRKILEREYGKCHR